MNPVYMTFSCNCLLTVIQLEAFTPGYFVYICGFLFFLFCFVFTANRWGIIRVMLKGTSTVFTNLPLFLTKDSALLRYGHYGLGDSLSDFVRPPLGSFQCDTELANMFEWRLLKWGCWQKDNKHLQKLLHPAWQNEQEMTSEENTVIHCLLGLFWGLIMCNSTAF